MQKPSDILVLPLNHTPFETDFEALAKQIVLEELNDFDCTIFLFGSRATKQNHRFSDMDIGIVPGKDFNDKILIRISEKINDSIIPYKVDIVNFKNVSEKFKKDALKHVVYWKK